MQGEARRKVIDTIWSQLMSLDKDKEKSYGHDLFLVNNFG